MRRTIVLFFLCGFVVIHVSGCASISKRYEEAKEQGTSDAYLHFLDSFSQSGNYYKHPFVTNAKDKVIELFSHKNINSLELRYVKVRANRDTYNACSYCSTPTTYGNGIYSRYNNHWCYLRGEEYASRIMELLANELKEKGYSVKIGEPINYLYYFENHGSVFSSVVYPLEQRAKCGVGLYNDIEPFLKKIEKSDADAILTFVVRAENAQDSPYIKGGTGADLSRIAVEYNIYAVKTKERVMSGSQGWWVKAPVRGRITTRPSSVEPSLYFFNSVVITNYWQYTESEEAYCSRVVKELLKDLPKAKD